MATTSSMGTVFFISFLGTGADLTGCLDTAVAGTGEGGPGSETRLTLMDPGENLGLGADAGQNTTEPKKIRWMARDIPKYNTKDWDPAPLPTGYARAYGFLFICFWFFLRRGSYP